MFVARNALFKSSYATDTCGRSSSSAELFCRSRTMHCPLVSMDHILTLDRAAVNRGRCDRGIVGSAMPNGRHSRGIATRDGEKAALSVLRMPWILREIAALPAIRELCCICDKVWEW